MIVSFMFSSCPFLESSEYKNNGPTSANYHRVQTSFMFKKTAQRSVPCNNFVQWFGRRRDPLARPQGGSKQMDSEWWMNFLHISSWLMINHD